MNSNWSPVGGRGRVFRRRASRGRRHSLIEVFDLPIPLLDLREGFGPEIFVPQSSQVVGAALLLLDPGEILEVVELLAVLVVQLAEVVGRGAVEVALPVHASDDLAEGAFFFRL